MGMEAKVGRLTMFLFFGFLAMTISTAVLAGRMIHWREVSKRGDIAMIRSNLDYDVLSADYRALQELNTDLGEEIERLMSEMSKLASLQPIIGIVDPDDIQLIIEQLTPATPFDSVFKITAGFGEGTGYEGSYRTSHKGTDMVPAGNWYVHPMWNGIVTDIGIHQFYGKYIVIQIADNIRLKYFHLEKIFNTALPESEVTPETIVGIMGSTGYSDGCHLHAQLEVFDGFAWIPVDLEPFLDRS